MALVLSVLWLPPSSSTWQGLILCLVTDTHVCTCCVFFILTSVDELWAGPTSWPLGVLLLLKAKPSGESILLCGIQGRKPGTCMWLHWPWII